MHFLHYVVYLTSILSSVFKSINLLNIVNGGFTLWTQWSTCTRTCGGGTTTRQRFCTNPAPANGGLTCAQQQATIGNEVEKISCNTQGSTSNRRLKRLHGATYVYPPYIYVDLCMSVCV